MSQGMLIPHRRHMAVLVVGILALLLLSNLVPDPAGRGIWRGGQKPADASWVQRMHGRLQQFGFYFQDNFGFRASLPVLREDIRHWAASQDSDLVYTGRDGQLFWAGQSAPAQSAGALYRKAAVERFAMVAMALQRELTPDGTKVVVAVPPNAQSVDIADLPVWNDKLPPRPTEYSLMLEELKIRGIAAVDLREVLRQSPDNRRFLPNDTHWTSLSSVLAFNATMRAAGLPDWQLDVTKVVGPVAPYPLGDLARSLRRTPQHPDENQILNLKDTGAPSPFVFRAPHEIKQFNGYALRYADSGPRVLILGDSYSIRIWPLLFAYTPAAEVGWMHFSRTIYGSCDFDFNEVKRFKPDLLIIARAERLFPCLNGAWPSHLPLPY